MLRPLLDCMLTGEEVDVPAVTPPCTMTAAADGGMLLVTVWGPPQQGARVPIATIGVAPKSRGAERLWDALRAPARTERPAAPWCAAKLWPGLALCPDAAHWLGDFERVLAWTWLLHRPRTGAVDRDRDTEDPRE